MKRAAIFAAASSESLSALAKPSTSVASRPVSAAMRAGVSEASLAIAALRATRAALALSRLLIFVESMLKMRGMCA